MTLSLKSRIKYKYLGLLRRFFHFLSSRQSILLRLGFVERLRRRYAPTFEEIKQDIWVSAKDGCVVGPLRKIVEMESFKRRVMLIDPLSDSVLDQTI